MKLLLCIPFATIATGYPQSAKEPALLRCAPLHEGVSTSLLPCHSCTALRLGSCARGKAAGKQNRREHASTPHPLGKHYRGAKPASRGLGLGCCSGQQRHPSSSRIPQAGASWASRAPSPAQRPPPAPLTCSGPWKQILQSGVRMPLSTLLPSE